ncbi:hypothetical protein V7S43_013941 [Phytophthora oleae]|uniref:Uncharacterized protein n=1 Tax=Phytophthora oleae TaxID=2107226 RepID=A0ABD3F646_9STRA
MSLHLIQIKRALATNFDALPEPEPEQDGVYGSMLNAAVDNIPMLQSMSPTPQEGGECEGWQSHENPDELVIIDPTAMESTSKHKLDTCTQLWPHTSTSEDEKDVEIDPDDSLSSDSGGSDLSSLIGSDVFDSLPRDVSDLMDSCSVQLSYSSSSSLDSSVADFHPDNVCEALKDRPRPSSPRKTTDNLSCGVSSGPFNDRRQRSNSDSNTASTAPLTEPSDALLTVEPDKTTTKDAVASSTSSTSTPFERLQARIAVNYPPSNGGVLFTNSSRGDSRATGGSDSRRDRSHGSYKHQRRPRADTGRPEARPPQSLVTGRIDEVRVQEVEQFASQCLQSSTRTWKKAIVIERVTKAWTEVARFAFRPNAAGT